MKTKRKLRSALRAARRKWPVFPVHSVNNDGTCACDDPECSCPGKHPIAAHGVKDATTDEAVIRGWWKRFPNANIGIATGSRSGLVVLDIDPRHGGWASLERYEADFGPLPDCPTVQTGGGGRHFYFRHPGGQIKSRVGVFTGIDHRADGAYVVGPGSRHKSGERYVWQHGKTPELIPLPLLPKALLQLIHDKRSSVPQSDLVIAEGQRNATLASLAGTMRSRGFTPQAIEAALLEENDLRCNPPLPKREVINVARSISRYPPGEPGIVSAAIGEEVKAERKTLRFCTGKEIAKETPSDVPWLLPRYVAFGAITELAGKVKIGKSTFVTDLVHAVLDGSPFLGQQTAKTSCVYLTEQPIISFRATLERSGLLGRKDFTSLLWLDTLGFSWPSVAAAAVDECKRRGAKLLIVDTLPQFAGLIGDTENNAGDALKALQPLQKAAAERIAVIIVRHERKSGGALGDSGRGSSAFAGGVDVLTSLRKPEGNNRRNVRLLQAVSRLGEADELLMELTDAGYRSLGAPGEAAKAQATEELLSQIPKKKKSATTIEELMKSTTKSRAQLQQLLDGLIESGEIVRIGKGRKGAPYRYWKA